jgi:amino acid transporter
MPSLVGAAALLVDYVLTVAVSVAAGVLALTSAAPSLASHKVELSLAFVLLLTVVNLRGVRESGIAFAIPTYAFVAAMYVLVATGLWKCGTGSCPQARVPDPVESGTGGLTVFLLVSAFAGGAVALTGVEAISNGVGAFRPPKGKNAATTLAVLGVISITLLLGVSYLTVAIDAMPSESVSLVSEIARAVFPEGSAAAWMYYAVQFLTFGILILAANTSYQGFPRLAAVLARDRYFPRQFVNLGDRLVYSNGIIVLAAAAALLIWVFHSDVIALIHLYVIGVFTAFTLSQAGMVQYWRKWREPHWRRRVAVNGVGAATTGLVTVLVIQAKFAEGAWMVTIAIPLLIVSFLAVNRHYRVVARRLKAGTAAVRASGPVTNTAVVYVETLDAATRRAAWYANVISGGDFHPIHVRGVQGADPRGRWWDAVGGGPRIETLEPVENAANAVLDYIWGLPRGESSFVTVVLPEHFAGRSLAKAVMKRTTFSLKYRLLTEPGVVVCNVPVNAAEDGSDAERAVGRVLVSGAHAATLRAVNYAASLGLADTRAVFFAFDADEASAMSREWARADAGVPLEIVEAPFRDLGDPLLRYVRKLTAEEGTVASVIMPELVFGGMRRLLHNQRALYIKRVLLFEPRVILSSVPYHLP